MPSAVVIPCLNEEETLSSTCASLGFGGEMDAVPDETYLVLVDNGSNDSTPSKMEEIKSRSPPGKVFLSREPERGYVPARHRGVLEAREIAAAKGIPEADLLVLQADADTRYSAGYAAEMQAAAQGRQNFLLEGISDSSSGFDDAFSGYRALSDQTDAALRYLFPSDADEVIVSDNLAGYLLKDYFSWGGHRREFNKNGDEIYAETSRLFIKAKLLGARKLIVDGAIGQHSRRKILQRPVLHFATAGFPREKSWSAIWAKRFADFDNLGTFSEPDYEHKLRQAIFLRQAHSLLIFGLIPTYISLLLGETNGQHEGKEFQELMPLVGNLSKRDIGRNTASLFENAFAVIDLHEGFLEGYLGKINLARRSPRIAD